MYYQSKLYSHLHYGNSNPQTYHSDFNSRNAHGQDHQLLDAIVTGIKREATAIDLYRRLASVAPNEKHKNDILQVLAEKKSHLTQFTHLYLNFTGNHPKYQIDKVHFHSYREGLQKAYEAEVKSCDEYQKAYSFTQNPHVQNVFMRVLSEERKNADWLGFLQEEVFNRVTDYGSEPLVIDIEKVTKQNNTFRTALWTGDHLQVTLMSIGIGEDIGLEVHPTLDQFLRIEEGQGFVQMGDSKDNLYFQTEVFDDYAIVVPAGKWHNLINTGNKPIKLYSIYAPPQHPYGTVHETKAIAMAAEEEHHH